ncbi:MAG: LTA synthase family protein, partial [Candidatus Nanosynbacter sp.]|nr:LTA synthase family protein [Candidatus Nanosynbacter sp.]
SQPFYENTTIIISGDHLGMQTSYYDEKIGGTNYQRTIYNTFINPAISTSHSKNRQFTTFDMYPSTLAALGVKIDGDRLGLGTNLFSGKKTLVEQYGGIENLNSELSKRSAYYENKIFTKSGN